jgi:hypothetical protein
MITNELKKSAEKQNKKEGTQRTFNISNHFFIQFSLFGSLLVFIENVISYKVDQLVME